MTTARRFTTFRAYVSDIGRVAYLSLCVLTAATLALELLAPGVAANVVSPQRLVAAALLAGACALFAPHEARPAPWKAALYGSTAAFALLAAFFIGLSYFSSVPLACAAAFAAALPFIAYSRGGGR